MSCPHTETTAVLAAFGEAPTDFEAHLQQCEACLQVVRQHTSTLAAIEPLTRVEQTDKKQWSIPAIGFLIAAASLLALQFTDPSKVNTGTIVPTQTLTVEVDLFDDPIDENLTSIELEIDLFLLEES